MIKHIDKKIEEFKMELSDRYHRDVRGVWFRKHETGMVAITDEGLIDTLDIRYETNRKLRKAMEETYEEGKEDGRKPYTESNRKSRQKYVSDNKCRVCGKLPLTGKTLCNKHRKMQNERQKRYLKRKEVVVNNSFFQDQKEINYHLRTYGHLPNECGSKNIMLDCPWSKKAEQYLSKEDNE